MLDWSLNQRSMPVVIRVPVGPVVSRPDLVATPGSTDFSVPSYQIVREGEDVAILALGAFLPLGEQIADALATRGIHATVVNPRFAAELDEVFLAEAAERYRALVTLEDGVLEGGWGEKVARFLAADDIRIRCYGIRKGFPDRYKPEELLAENGITVEGITADIEGMLA